MVQRFDIAISDGIVKTHGVVQREDFTEHMRCFAAGVDVVNTILTDLLDRTQIQIQRGTALRHGLAQAHECVQAGRRSQQFANGFGLVVFHF